MHYDDRSSRAIIIGGSHRVNRGGDYTNAAANLRAANRDNNEPSNRDNDLGFRLCSTVDGLIRNLHGCCDRVA